MSRSVSGQNNSDQPNRRRAKSSDRHKFGTKVRNESLDTRNVRKCAPVDPHSNQRLVLLNTPERIGNIIRCVLRQGKDGILNNPENFVSNEEINFALKYSSNMVEMKTPDSIGINIPRPELCKFPGCLGNCRKLHICRNIINEGDCTNVKCKFEHDFYNSGNRKYLAQYYLDKPDINLDIVRHLIKINDKKREKIQFCPGYQQNTCMFGEKCFKLHFCKPYFEKRCQKGESCNLSHDIQDQKCRKILQQNGYNSDKAPNLIIEDLRYHLQAASRDADNKKENATLQVCPGYQRNACKFGDKCFKLHFCKLFLEKKCLNQSCPLSHVPDHQCRKILQQNGFETSKEPSQIMEDIAKVTQIAMKRECNASEKTVNSNIGKEICTHNLYGRCKFGHSCFKRHTAHTFAWDILDNNGTWLEIDTDTAKKLEEAYCYPKIQLEIITPTQATYNFSHGSMTCIDARKSLSQIRRVGTEATLAAVVTHTFTTDYVWYFCNEKSQFEIFGLILGNCLETQLTKPELF